jgi:hypothetical protein
LTLNSAVYTFLGLWESLERKQSTYNRDKRSNMLQGRPCHILR